MQLGELVNRLGLPYRSVRFALEHGHANRWVHSTEGSGHYRELSLGAAFALGLLVKLKQMGLRTPIAAHVVEFVEESLRGVGRQLSWDPGLDPFRGQLETKYRWIAEIGDANAFRLLTDSSPSRGRQLEAFTWVSLGKPRREIPDFQPLVTIRIDLARFFKLLRT